MQPTHTAHGVDLAAIAAAAGFPVTGTVRDAAALGEAVAKVRSAHLPLAESTDQDGLGGHQLVLDENQDLLNLKARLLV